MDKKEVTPLKEKLENEVGTVDWKVLNAHYLRGALIAVSHDLNLVEVGLKVTEDCREEIRHWIEKGKLLKPTPGEVEEWKENSTQFSSLIVSPYVLIQTQH